MGQVISKRKIIFHIDVNGTIILFDSTDLNNVSEAIKEYISKMVYGIVIDNKWTSNAAPFIEQGISFADYIKKLYSKDYKQYLIQFTDLDEGKRFETIFTEMMSVYSEMIKNKQTIFQSFYNLMKEYPEAVFVFRTFGNDGEMIEKILGRTFIWFDSIIDENGKRFMKRKSDNKAQTIKEFNNFLCTTTEMIIVKENYNYWNTTIIENEIKVDKPASRGKYIEEYVLKECFCKNPFCKTRTEKYEVIQIFFDDNNCVNKKGNHVYVQRVNPYLALCEPDYFVINAKKFIAIDNNSKN